MRQSLQTQLFVSFMLVVSLILAGFAVGASALVRQYFFTAKQQELISKGHEMALILDEYLSGRMSSTELAELVDRIDGFLDARIWAVDSSGRMIVMSTSRFGINMRPSGAGSGTGMGQGLGSGRDKVRSSTVVRDLVRDMAPVFRGEVLTRTFFHPYYEEDMMIVAVPLKSASGVTTGAVILNAPIQGLNSFLTKVYLAVGLTGLLSLGLTLFIVRRLSRGIVRPLRAMEETAASMAEGCYDKRVEVASKDEIGQLGESLNTLAQALSGFVARTEQTEKLRRDFVANVSHELRTPLTVIRGYTEALRDGTVTEPEQADRFNRLIVSETERLERLISDLLDLSRLQAEQYTMEVEPIPLQEIIDSVVGMLRVKADEKGVTLLWRCEIQAQPVLGNGDRLIQLMLILLDNALKYTPAGGSVSIELAQSDGQARVTVADTGVGIPSEDLPFIWERFYKVDKAHTRHNQGTGLGLSIAREIVERHGAKVTVSSGQGKGTAFVLIFPIALS